MNKENLLSAIQKLLEAPRFPGCRCNAQYQRVGSGE